jgi:hypothetical protein
MGQRVDAKGTFVILRGFIDESYDRQNIFLLSALVGLGTEWRWLSRDWMACIDKWNTRLLGQGRKPISRFHAAECNSLDNEFEGWSRPEQIELMKELIGIIGRVELHCFSWALDLEDFKCVFPETRNLSDHEYVGSIYGFMSKFMAYRLAPPFVTANPAVRISLEHDHCDHDAVIADAFGKATKDTSFKERDCYTYVMPASSFEVVPLQMADLLCHESFKETKRKYASGQKTLLKQRSSLKALIELGNIGGGVEYIPVAALQKLKRYLEGQR